MAGTRHRIAAVALGLVVGLAGMLAVDAMTSNTSLPAALASTTTSTTLPPPVWRQAGELVVGPAVIVPERFSEDDGRIPLRYVLEPIAPAAHPAEEEVDTVVFPERWTLLTTAGEHTTGVPPWSREAEFEVPEGVTIADVVGVRLDTYWLRTPVRFLVETGADAADPIEVGPGLTMRIATVTTQPNASVVAVELQQESGVGIGDLAVEGVGAAWLTSSVDQTLARRWSMAYAGGELPDPLVLQVRGVAWLPRPAGLVMDVAAVPDGP